MLHTLNVLAKPLSGMIEKGCLAFFMYAAGKGWIVGIDVAPLAAASYAVISAALTAAVNSQEAKIKDVNASDNGVKVVPAIAAAHAVDVPLPESNTAK